MGNTLTRLCYASQTVKEENAIRQDLMDILTEAVNFNQRHQVYGVLYYGGGKFFQCLEGDSEIVNPLFYEKITKDPRHTGVELLDLTEISDVKFGQWHMKYAPYDKAMLGFFNDRGISEFDPFILQEQGLEDFISYLLKV
ncbi:Sensors of blue-light using FAD [Acinetobacter marinus]|uniref:Sensors of blue-light using FAD n=1 Tax=Acinetobacter marinus TaxID=281375 RepID=A0A1G6HNH2_9GAMM|nr:BLUF domain-containing protein [Acinetobacter marinus]SDB95693.1 Sensors of blue-light using FAD [Acinetobacter marinus]